MREILFRGKRVDNNEWVYGSLIVYSVTKDGKTKKYDIKLQDAYNTNLDSYRVISETVSQFTGLTDKNGVKIFINDTYKDEQGDLFKVIQMKCGRYALQMLENNYTDEFIDWSEVEIIGNIHDANV